MILTGVSDSLQETQERQNAEKYVNIPYFEMKKF